MKLETKYGLRQKVWIMVDNKPLEVEIHDLVIRVGMDGHSGPTATVEYRYYHGTLSHPLVESLFYETRQQLIDSL
jgi:hypothetical protein